MIIFLKTFQRKYDCEQNILVVQLRKSNSEKYILKGENKADYLLGYIYVYFFI